MTENEDVKSTHFLELSSENLILLGIEFDNGYFISISDKNTLKLGTTAVTLPNESITEQSLSKGPAIKGISSSRGIITATVLGSRNELYAKALAEKLVFMSNKLTYLSVFFDENNEDYFKEAILLVEELIKSKSE